LGLWQNHERGHFDLTGICARRLRKHLLKLSESCENISLDIELNLALDWYDSISKMYDRETQFGTNRVDQNIWSKKISDDLLELDNYADQIVVCLCNR
jgi:hypothetical protein